MISLTGERAFLTTGIFGVQIEYLRYVSWLFKHNVFLWIMLAFIVFACFYYVVAECGSEE